MAKGIEIGVGVDTKAAKQGLESGLITPLEDAQSALEDLGKDRGPEELERNLKAAQDASERLQKETKDTADIIEREYKDAYRKQKQAAEDGMHGASKATGEFKDEFKQNLSEVTSSFDGSMNSVQDLAQGTLGGLAVSLTGPLAVGAAVGAAAIGAVGGALIGVQQETEESKQRAAEWAQAFVEAGGKVLTAAQTTEAGLDIITDPDKFKKAQENAKNWGVSLSTAIAAMTGQQWALDAATESVEKLTAAQDAQWEATKKQAASGSGNPNAIMAEAIVQVGSQATKGAESLEQLKKEIEEGGKQAADYSQFLIDMAKHTEGAKETIDEFGDSLFALPDGTTIYVDAETRQATKDVDAIERKIYSLPTETKIAVGVAGDFAELDRELRKPRKLAVDFVTRDGRRIY